ncbi:MAG: hypothetical protein M3P97_01170 [Actinomycetota bacterium]|nr:hypothetical protein [Actinomycetota bacterium]
MDYLPLVLMVLVLVGAAVLVPYLRRLKRAARAALEASRQLEARLQTFQAQQGMSPPTPGRRPGDEGAVRPDDPRS